MGKRLVSSMYFSDLTASTWGFLATKWVAVLLIASLPIGCGGSSNGASDAPPLPGPVEPPPPPPEPEVLLFSVIDNPDGSGQPFKVRYVGARAFDPSVDPPSVKDGGVIVFAEAVDLDPGYGVFNKGVFLGSTADFNYFRGSNVWGQNSDKGWLGGNLVGPAYVEVLSAGEGDSNYGYVSFAEIQNVYAANCSQDYGCSIIRDIAYEYFLFGNETLAASPNYSPEYNGSWRGEVLLIGGDGVDFDQGFHVEGPAQLVADLGAMTIQGTLSAETVLSNQRYSLCFNCINLADINLAPTTLNGGTFSGSAGTSLTALTSDDRLVGTYEGSFFGPDAEEVGGLIFLGDDHSHRSGADPDPDRDIILYGVFVGQ